MKINFKTTMLTGMAALGLAIVLPATASAALTGVCSSCHTMHNSQNGGTVYDSTGGSNANLLKFDCIGCHAQTGVVNTGSGTPQIHDSGTGTDIASGYFSTGASTTTHNVTGLTIDDTILTAPPGGAIPGGGNLSCDTANGCHSATGVHHSNTVGSYVTTGYRFLTGTVAGYESTNWEFNDAATGTHNIYHATVTTGANSVNALCNTCHDNFHGQGVAETEQGLSGAWIRHPTDIDVFTLTTKEYVSFNAPAGAEGQYNVEVPVGSDSAGGAYDSNNLTTGDGYVMCVSCHRAHGSQYNDLLRWSYSTMNAGGSGTTGCFRCHTQKN